MVRRNFDTFRNERLSSLDNEVHLYSCGIDTLDITQQYNWITNEEMKRASAFRKKEDAQRFLTGRAVAKIVVAQYLNIGLADVIIAGGKNRKPFATCDQESVLLPHFNISHSGSRVVVAFSTEPVGIDIEEMKDIDLEDLAGAVFSKTELDRFEKSENKLLTFYQFWTRKEAMLKALGLGLVDDLKQIDIGEGIDMHFVQHHTDQQLTLDSFELAGNYFASICYSASKQPVLFELPAGIFEER